MPRSVVYERPVTAEGVGREDWSEDVEQSVEPVTIGWQSDYNSGIIVFGALNAGQSASQVINIGTDNVVILYDLILTNYAAVDLTLELDYYDAQSGLWLPLIVKRDNRTVEIHLTKGLPMNSNYMITATNHDALNPTVDLAFTANGVSSSKEQYYGTVT